MVWHHHTVQAIVLQSFNQLSAICISSDRHQFQATQYHQTTRLSETNQNKTEPKKKHLIFLVN